MPFEAIEPKLLRKDTTRTMKSEIPSNLARSGERKGGARVRIEITRNRIVSRVAKKKLTLEESQQAQRNSGLFICDARCPISGPYCKRRFIEKGVMIVIYKKYTCLPARNKCVILDIEEGFCIRWASCN